MATSGPQNQSLFVCDSIGCTSCPLNHPANPAQFADEMGRVRALWKELGITPGRPTLCRRGGQCTFGTRGTFVHTPTVKTATARRGATGGAAAPGSAAAAAPAPDMILPPAVSRADRAVSFAALCAEVTKLATAVDEVGSSTLALAPRGIRKNIVKHVTGAETAFHAALQDLCTQMENYVAGLSTDTE
jgi:hypothetical protein